MFGTHLLSQWHLSYRGWVTRIRPSVGTLVSYVTLTFKVYVHSICSTVRIYSIPCAYAVGVERRDKQCVFKADIGAMGDKSAARKLGVNVQSFTNTQNFARSRGFK